MANYTTTRKDGTQVTLGGPWGDQANAAVTSGLEFDPTTKAEVDVTMTDIAQIAHTPQEAVINDPVDAIVATPATDTLDLSNAETQQIAVADSNGNNVIASCTFSTSDATKATVSAGGLITPVGVGAATITVRYERNGNVYTDTIAVTVIA